MLYRFSIGSLLTGVLLLAGPLLAQAQDRVDYFDRTASPAKKVPASGEIVSENPVEVVVKGTTTSRKVPVIDIDDVSYEAAPGEAKQALAAERIRDYDKALGLYRDALRSAPAAHKYVKPHLRFKIARLLVLQVEAKGGEGRSSAIDELRNFRKEYPDSRQIVECLELLSRLLLADGQSTDEVTAAIRDLKGKYGPALGNRLDLFEGQLLVQEAENLLDARPADAKKKYAEAQTKLEVLLKDAGPATALDIKVAVAECKAGQGKQADAIKELEAILAAASDDRTRAAAFLGRGDCYRLNKQLREAMWDYLWVDVVYSQDREQNAKALYHLHSIFKQLNDNDRSERCKERLEKDFTGTRYQKMLANK